MIAASDIVRTHPTEDEDYRAVAAEATCVRCGHRGMEPFEMLGRYTYRVFLRCPQCDAIEEV